MLKKLTLLLLAGVLVLSATACGKKPETSEEESSEPEQGPSYRVAAVFPEENDIAAQIMGGCKAAAKAANVTINFEFSYGDRTTESQFLAGVPDGGFDGVIALPAGEEASLADLSRISSKGVPVAVAGAISARNDFAQGMFGADPYKLGEALGLEAKAYITDQLAGKAKLAIVEQPFASFDENTLRINGFLDQLKDMKDVTLVWAFQADPEKDIAEQLDAYIKDETKAADIILCTGGDLTLAAHEAIGKASSKSVLFGLDCSSETVEILQGTGSTLQGVAAHNYHEMGYKAMESLLAAITEQRTIVGPAETIAPVVLTPTTMNAMGSFVEGLTP